MLQAFKRLGWIFAAICWTAIGLSITSAVIAGTKYGIGHPATIISIVCASGFIFLYLFPLFLFYAKFYSHIDMELALFPTKARCYIISNGLFDDLESPAIIILQSINSAIADVWDKTSLFYSHDAMLDTLWEECLCRLDSIIIVFARDINEVAYFQRWGVKYSHISGVNYGSVILVEVKLGQKLIDTAFAHELYHSFVDGNELLQKDSTKYVGIRKALGLE